MTWLQRDESKGRGAEPSSPLQAEVKAGPESHQTWGYCREVKYRSCEREGSESHFFGVPCAKFHAMHTVGVNEERDGIGCESQDRDAECISE